MSRYYNDVITFDDMDNFYLEHFGRKGQKWYRRFFQSYESKPTRSGKIGQEFGKAAADIGRQLGSLGKSIDKDFGTLRNRASDIGRSTERQLGDLGKSLNNDFDMLRKRTNDIERLNDANLGLNITDSLKYILGIPSKSRMAPPTGGKYRQLDYGTINKGLQDRYNQYISSFSKSASRLPMRSDSNARRKLKFNREALINDIMSSLGTYGDKTMRTSTGYKRFVNRFYKRMKRQKKYEQIVPRGGLNNFTKRYVNDYTNMKI